MYMDIKKGEEAAAPSISRLTLSMAEALFAFFSLPRLLLARRGIGLFIIYAHCWSSISSSSSFLSLSGGMKEEEEIQSALDQRRNKGPPTKPSGRTDFCPLYWLLYWESK